jgi:hypothetical protein
MKKFLPCNNSQVVNLILIKGIDLWVEEKNLSDIFTFEQFNKHVAIEMERNTEVSDILPDKLINLVTLVWELAINQLDQSMN